MKAFAIAATVLAMAVTTSSVQGSATLYLSEVSLESGITPVPGNPDLQIGGPGESVTLHLWAQLSSVSTSTAMGLDFAETNPAVVAVTDVTVANPLVWRDPDDPDNPESWLYRWNGYATTQDWWEPAGFAAIGGFNDPMGVHAVGLTTLYGATDPTRRGTSGNYHYYIGSVTFTLATIGMTDVFLTVNDTLMLGNGGMLNDMHFGAGDGAAPVSSKVEGSLTTYYIAEGVHSTLADATLGHACYPYPPEPEPGTAAMVAIGGLTLVRRR